MKYFLCLIVLISFSINAQIIKLLTYGTKTSLRGLSVVSDKIIWVSGSNGMAGRSIDGGVIWKWFSVKGFERIDFRDIEAFDSLSAVIMGISEPAYILKTNDGGETWKIVYENKIKGIFLDAMDFKNKKGVVVGDPLNNKFFIATTFDRGNTWHENNNEDHVTADSGEACFASSGTNIRMVSKHKEYFISGGSRSRLFLQNKIVDLPIMQGEQSAGANSIAIKNKKTFIIVGGDFNTPDSAFKNCILTFNKGRTWVQPAIAPHGYRSCVEHLNKKSWIACGLNGVDYTTDNGITWQWISKESFNVCRRAKKGNAVFFAGANGRIGKLSE